MTYKGIKNHITVFGTTSSGKSTLVNALIGGELLPSAVQEMTTAPTTISHHPRRRVLTIIGLEKEPVTKSLAACEGGLTSDALRNTLHKVFYDSDSTDCRQDIHLKIEWPLGLANDLLEPQLSAEGLQIVDMPGLKYVGDDKNTRTIPDDSSVIVIVFGADHTDPRRQQTLLQSVLTQNPDLESIIFVLNKVDILLSDRDPTATLSRLRRNLYKSICTAILEYYPHTTLSQESIDLVEVAARPALHARIANKHATPTGLFKRLWSQLFDKTNEQIQIDSIDRLLREHRWLIDHKTLGSLPRAIKDWPHEPRVDLANSIEEYSNIHALESAIAHRI